MDSTTRTVDGEPLTTKLAMRMEDSLQAFAVRAAVFIGELDVPYTEEFDGHDFSATHIVAYVGSEPAGAVRLRWLPSFAMPERLAVIQRFRGHGIAAHLLERCRALAESRGSSRLYVQALPANAGYFDRLGWERLDGETAEPGGTVAFALPVAAVQTPTGEPEHPAGRAGTTAATGPRKPAA
ncbi:MAG: GNAT family N-acetyltransferase [Reyranellaceae bacterium]